MDNLINYSELEYISNSLKSTAFYTIDLKLFEKNYNTFLSAAQSIYSNSNIAYSYKTNYLPAICKKVNELGGLAEVVSEFEYDLAELYSINKSKIIVNGPIHTQEFIDRVLSNKSILQIDSLYILELVENYVIRTDDTQINIALRLNFKCAGVDFSRFGISNSNNNYLKAKSFLNKYNIELVGLHCHFSTGSRSLESYKSRIQILIKLFLEDFKEFKPKYINVGGGYFSNMPMSLKNQFSAEIPKISDYSTIVSNEMKKIFPNEEVLLYFEPGTALTADIMEFYCKVLTTKNINNNKIAIVDGSVQNIKPTGNSINLPCKVISKEKEETNNSIYQITGYTCMERDILYKDFNGHIKSGDYLQFSNVGAYTIVFKPPFIKTQVAVIAYTDGNIIIHKRSEKVEDLMTSYVL